jgi:hypothetical protein
LQLAAQRIAAPAMGVLSFVTSFYGNGGTKFPEKVSAEHREACERFGMSLETWQRQKRAFGLLRNHVTAMVLNGI